MFLVTLFCAQVCPRPARRLQELRKHLDPSHLNARFRQIFLEAFKRHRLIFCHVHMYFFFPMRLLKTEISHSIPTYSPSLDCSFICKSSPLGQALDEHLPPQEKKKKNLKQPNLWKCTVIQAPVTYLNERFKGTFLLEKTWHIPRQKIQNPLSHLSYGFILSVESVLKIYYSTESYHFKNGSRQLPFVWGCSLLQRLKGLLGLDPNFTEVKARILTRVHVHPCWAGWRRSFSVHK